MNSISLSAFALWLATVFSITSVAAETPVYKCMQDGVALYTDTPCKDAALVDIHPGVADPAARARLERAKLRSTEAPCVARRTKNSNWPAATKSPASGGRPKRCGAR